MPSVYEAIEKEKWDILEDVHWDNVPKKFHGTLGHLLYTVQAKFIFLQDSSLKEKWQAHHKPFYLNAVVLNTKKSPDLAKVHIVSMNEAFNDVNDQSTILICSMPNIKMNFVCTGDASNASFQRIASYCIPSVINSKEYSNVLILPHHGSEENLSKLMFTQFNPHLVAISAGNGRQFGHPRQNTVEFYGKLLTQRKLTGNLDFFDKFQVEGLSSNKFLAYTGGKNESHEALLYDNATLPIISTNLSGNFLFDQSGCLTNFSTIFELPIGEMGAEKTVEFDFRKRKNVTETDGEINLVFSISDKINLVKQKNSLYFRLNVNQNSYFYSAKILED